jgi:hypothetical protein
MARSIRVAMIPALLFASAASAQQYPILDKVAQKVVEKYRTASCEQLAQERMEHKPKPEAEQKVIEILRNDAQMRAAFLDRVAAPIANKLFECGLIP